MKMIPIPTPPPSADFEKERVVLIQKIERQLSSETMDLIDKVDRVIPLPPNASWEQLVPNSQGAFYRRELKLSKAA
jgi:hypothetical protein